MDDPRNEFLPDDPLDAARGILLWLWISAPVIFLILYLFYR